MSNNSAPSKAAVHAYFNEWVGQGKPPVSTFARATGKPEPTARRWLKHFAPLYGIDEESLHAAPPPVEPRPVFAGPTADEILRDENRALKSQLASLKREQLDEHYIKSVILKMADAPHNPPEWIIRPQSTDKKSPGVPTLFASDWHWGEVVDPTQIMGVNTFDIGIAHKRAKSLVEGTIGLLRDHMVNPDYPGIVFALGGDMVSGGIHEELMATDEMEIMPTVMDLFDVLCGCIKTLANEFGAVFIPGVTGNHGRSTHKIRHKGRVYTNYDWLLYQFLARYFQEDKRVSFLIPDGPDAYFKIYNHRYLMTHGDQFRGGDGMIGALGPIIRGDHKKRSRNGQIDLGYDTLMLGHWHQLIQLRRLIVNGSLKGYDEYANNNNFGFEPPQQALWMTHPTRGITFSMPVQVEKPTEVITDWISIPGAK